MRYIDNQPAEKFRVIDFFQLILYLLVPLLWIFLSLDFRVNLPLLYLISLQVAVATYFVFARANLFIPSLFFIMLLLTTYLPLPPAIWLINILITIGVLTILLLLIPPLKKLAPEFPIGRFDKKIIIYSLAVIIVSTAALIAWRELTNPDLRPLIAIPDRIDHKYLIAAILAFPVFNALAEELMFRWILWDGLAELLKIPAAVIIIQAALFGLCHYRGFPNGWLGVVLAFCYGLMLGFIRHKSNGLLAPIVTHIFADMTIILIIFGSAGMF